MPWTDSLWHFWTTTNEGGENWRRVKRRDTVGGVGGVGGGGDTNGGDQ